MILRTWLCMSWQKYWMLFLVFRWQTDMCSPAHETAHGVTENKGQTTEDCIALIEMFYVLQSSLDGLIFISRVICIALLLIWHHFYRYMRTWTLNICTKSCGHNMLTCYSYDLICKRVFCQHVVSLLNMILYEVWKPILKYIGQPNLEHTI